MIVGIDEVGRGSWAGPLVAAAVLFDKYFVLPSDAFWKLSDSKALTKLQRQRSAQEIKSYARAIGIGWVSAAEIDDQGLTAAVRTAMSRALSGIDEPYQEIIIDGHYNFLHFNPKARSLIKADRLISVVSAASIIAKVARDEYMTEIAGTYPQYQFERHVGYGTKLHYQLLKQYGTCPLHRQSYKPIRMLLGLEAKG